MTLGSIDILTVWIFLNSWSWDIFEFVFNFFKQCFYSFHCTNLPWLISKYFILFDDISSGIVFYSHCSLIAYRTVADFLCVDFLSYNLADLFIGSNRFVGVCNVEILHIILYHLWSEIVLLRGFQFFFLPSFLLSPLPPSSFCFPSSFPFSLFLAWCSGCEFLGVVESGHPFVKGIL